MAKTRKTGKTTKSATSARNVKALKGHRVRAAAPKKTSVARALVGAVKAAATPGKGAKSTRHVYFFGDGKADGNRTMKDVLGGKGSGLAEMTNAGLPVPPGFTISTG